MAPLDIAEPPADHLLGVYNRAQLAFDRGEGARLYTAEGEAYLDCSGRDRDHGARPRPSQAGGGAEGPGREAVARLQHIPHSGSGGAGRALVRGDLRRRGLLHQLGDRGHRVRAEDGAEVSLGERGAGADRRHRLRRRLPRPQLRRGLRRRQPELRRGLRPSPARLCQPAVRRHGGGEGGDRRADCGGGDHRAGAGRRRGAGAAGSLPHRPARTLRRPRRLADLRRNPVRPRTDRQAVRA